MNERMDQPRFGSRAAAILPAIALLCLVGVAEAAVTGIRMESDPLDPIGMGMTYDLNAADGSFTLSGDAGTVRLEFQPNGPGDPWSFSFAAPSGNSLEPDASYSPAISELQSQSASALPTMSVTGGARNCAWVSGSFEVSEFTLDANGLPTSLRVTFEQHCDGDTPALRGDLRFNADTPVDIRAPFAQFANPGESIVFFALATDEAGGWVSISADGVPPGAFFMDFFDNSAVFVWTPTPSDLGTHRVTFRADNGQGGIGEASTFFRVGPPSEAPVASAGGPYEGRVGSPVLFNGSESFDPDAGTLTMFWDFGDGTTSTATRPEHTYAAAGAYTTRLVVCDPDRCVMDEAAVEIVQGVLSARAFLAPDDTVIRLGTGRPWFSVRVEPGAAGFDLQSVSLSSLWLRSEGTGSVASIGNDARRTLISPDSDRNGVAEINAAFAMSDLRDLFSSVTGEKSLPLTVEGLLNDGTPFQAEVMVTVISGPGNSLNAKISKSGGASLVLVQAASVTLQIFDVTGRLVSEVLSGSTLSAGEHVVNFAAGTGAPGIYFYRLQADTEVTTGRLFLAR